MPVPILEKVQMSSVNSIDVNCPFCGNKQKAALWSSINIGLNPDMKARLFQGDVNVLDCSACGKRSTLVAPLLYHDMDNGFCVQYYPPELLREEGFYDQFTVDGKVDMESILEGFMEPIDYLSSPHIVFNLQEMIHYIEFRDRLSALKKTPRPS